MTTEYEKARAWREALGLTQTQLGERIGYSREAIYWFEAGKTPPGRVARGQSRSVKEWIWQRYKMACAGLDAEIKANRQWNWPKV